MEYPVPLPTLPLPGAPVLRRQPSPFSSRQAEALSRLPEAYTSLKNCELCIHRCGTDRLLGPSGVCRAGAEPRVFSAQIDVGDELELIPTYAIAFSGCNMRCAYCVSGRESWHPWAGEFHNVSDLAASAASAVHAGAANTVLLQGGEPTIHLPWLLEFMVQLPENITAILKTNGIMTAEARHWLRGLFDTWLVDYKFSNDACALGISRTPGYTAAVQENILWAATEERELIIRHLVTPGHIECCWRPIAAWIQENVPNAKVSLRFGYWPAWKAVKMPDLNRPLLLSEQEQAMQIAAEFNINVIR
jgi:putative pyruvate formate lyase activating enzyme